MKTKDIAALRIGKQYRTINIYKKPIMVLSLLWVTSNLPIFGQIEIKSTVYLKDGSKLIGTLAKSETSGMYKLSLRNGLQLDVPVSIVRKIIQDEVKAEKSATASAKTKKAVTTPIKTAPTPPPGGFKKVIVDYKNVPDEVLKALSEKYPHGYNKAIIQFTNAKKELVSAVPIELGEFSYLVKVSTQLQKMVDDYDEDEIFTDDTTPIEKEISVGAGGDFDDFDKSDEDDSPKRKSKGKVKSADDLEYGFDDDDDDEYDDDDDDDDEDSVSDDDDDDDDE